MSGRDLVRGLRSEATPPPERPSRGASVLDFLIGAVAVIAVASMGYFGYATFFAHQPVAIAARSADPVLLKPAFDAPGPMVAVIETDQAWNDEDSARCKSAARAASEAPLPAEAALAQRSVAEGFASLATLVECQISSKIKRFCAPTEKGKLVAAVHDYLDRMDLLVLGMGVQGAPMAVMGEAFGGEVAFGSAVYDMQKEATFSAMRVHHRKVVAAIKTLAREGVVTAPDFGAFLGMGVPSEIKDMLKDVEAERNICTA